MKKFIIKIIYFIIPFAVVIVILLFSIEQSLNNEILNREIEMKILKLNNKINADIIIAGDSRADRQLVPAMIDSITGMCSVNIAGSSVDVVTTLYALKSYQLKKKYIIISASSWQINDGAIDPGYLSLKCFQKLTIFDKFNLFNGNLSKLIWIYKRLFLYKVYYMVDDLLIKNNSNDNVIFANKGFNGVSGHFTEKDSVDIGKYMIQHSWYKNWKGNGCRWRVFKESLKELSMFDSNFIIIQPPVSKYWKKVTENTWIENAENEYSKKLTDICIKYNNISFVNFYNEDLLELNDDMYYDYQHLNKKGARIFSIYIGKMIEKKIRLQSSILQKTKFVK